MVWAFMITLTMPWGCSDSTIGMPQTGSYGLSKPSDRSGWQLQTIGLWPFVPIITCRWALDAGSKYLYALP